jgi:mono/diheme cytochrome c family protein
MLHILLFQVVLAVVPVAAAEEVTYTQHIRPLFNARCAGCHGAESPEFAEFE